MDPKAANTLDPKLKETYDRVMGTPTQPGAAAAAPGAAPAPAAPAQEATPSVVTPQPADASSIPTTPYTPDNLKFQAAIQQPLTNPAAGAAPAPAAPAHQGSPVMRIVYILGSVIFFVAYTFLWVKIFNLPIPFLGS